MAALSGRLNTLINKHNTDIRLENAATICRSCDMAAGDASSTMIHHVLICVARREGQPVGWDTFIDMAAEFHIDLTEYKNLTPALGGHKACVDFLTKVFTPARMSRRDARTYWFALAHLFSNDIDSMQVARQGGLRVMWTLMIIPFALNYHKLRVHPRRLELSMSTLLAMWIRLCNKPYIHTFSTVTQTNQACKQASTEARRQARALKRTSHGMGFLKAGDAGKRKQAAKALLDRATAHLGPCSGRHSIHGT